MARRPGPSLRALLFWCGGGAVCEAFGGWKTAQTACFLVGSESDVRHWGPWPAGPVRPSGPCCFGVAKAPFVSLRGWKTDSGPCCFGVAKAPFVSLRGWKTTKTASFLVGSESNAKHWGPWPAVPVRPSEFRCLVKPPFVISSARPIGRCDIAFRWAYDA